MMQNVKFRIAMSCGIAISAKKITAKSTPTPISVVSNPDFTSILSVEKRPLSTKKTTSAITEKLVEKISLTTPNPTSETLEPSVTNSSENASSESVRSAVSKAGGTNS